VAHWVVFALPPLALELLRKALVIMFLPFPLIGFGDRRSDSPGAMARLKEPGCWIVLTPCSVAEKEWVSLRMAQQLQPLQPKAASASPSPDERWVSLPDGVNSRHVWFGLWSIWFLIYLLRSNARKLQRPNR
jgi:hypothetical protein